MITKFELNDREKSTAEHLLKIIKQYGGDVGEVTYQFTPTGIGVAIKLLIRDNVYDITDYDSW